MSDTFLSFDPHKKKDCLRFSSMIWDFYNHHGRQFPWRHVTDPYRVVVSEIMLQQTQTHRVIEKYLLFRETFSTWQMLAQASLRDVLSVWQGLGYNRRGRYLHMIAQKITSQYNGMLPDDPAALITFPGIGAATANSIVAFAFNKPTIFIETNIRAVFIHSFFRGSTHIHDRELLPLVEQTVDRDNPREWYYALMDYGVLLKKTCINPSRRSVHHTKQSAFEGSLRQVRGAIIKLLTNYPALCDEKIFALLPFEKSKIEQSLEMLLYESMICQEKNIFMIK